MSGGVLVGDHDPAMVSAWCEGEASPDCTLTCFGKVTMPGPSGGKFHSGSLGNLVVVHAGPETSVCLVTCKTCGPVEGVCFA